MSPRRILLALGLMLGLAVGASTPPAPLRPADPAQADGAADSGAVKTLIVTNLWRLRGLYPGDPQVGALERRLGDLAAHPRVRGRLLDVGMEPQTLLAYGLWDRDPTSFNANGVVERIKAQIDQAWLGAPQLAYLVIVGDDRVIPFLRVPDRSAFAAPSFRSEREYALLMGLSTRSTIGRALQDNQILTDDYYAYRADPRAAPRYYLPALGIGRLVEAPAEMLAVVETFLAGDTLVLGSAAVSARASGFGADLAGEECAAFARAGLRVDCALLTDSWTAEIFCERALGGAVRHDILAIHHHASHLAFGSYGEFVYASDLEEAEADLSRALVISSGCHAGLNVPPYDSGQPPDLAQAAMIRRANLLAGTSYGIAAVEGVGWSEALISGFERELLSDDEPTPGRALVAAKAAYHAATLDSAVTAWDEKASLQLTLYGLPMYCYLTPH